MQARGRETEKDRTAIYGMNVTVRRSAHSQLETQMGETNRRTIFSRQHDESFRLIVCWKRVRFALAMGLRVH
jgi:hypothetical protein